MEGWLFDEGMVEDIEDKKVEDVFRVFLWNLMILSIVTYVEDDLLQINE